MKKIGDISVVIPLYNRQDLIAETLASVERQRVLPAEVIVVNDRSTDGSVGVVRHFARRSMLNLRLMENTRKKGISGALNCGMENARGEYIAFQDSDDLWTPGHLEQLWGAIRKFPRASMAFSEIEVFGDARDAEKKGKEFEESIARCRAAAFEKKGTDLWQSNHELLKALLEWGVPFRIQASLSRRKFFLKHRLFFDEDVAYTLEGQLMTFAACYTPFLYVTKVGLRWRRHGENDGDANYGGDKIPGSYEVRAAKMREFFSDKRLSAEEKKALRKRLIELKMGALELRSRNDAPARRIMKGIRFFIDIPCLSSLKAAARFALKPEE